MASGGPSPTRRDGGSPLRPVSSFQPASSLPRNLNAPSGSGTSSAATTSAPSGSGSGQDRGVTQPKPRPLIRGAVGAGSTVLVNSCQRGNPVLQHIRNVGWEYGDIVPDYQVGVASCVLFLSLRYHRLHPEYIHTRIQKLQQMYTLRVLLVMCDVNDHQTAIRELTKVALINSLTMMVAWSAEEAGRYIETYKSFEHKPPDVIKERVNDDYMSQIASVLTSVRGVNKTDVVTLVSTFGSLRRISTATVEELAMCPGFGELKAKRLRDVFHQPFRVGETRSRVERRRTAAAGGGGDGGAAGTTTGGGGDGETDAPLRPVEVATSDVLLPSEESAPAAPTPPAPSSVSGAGSGTAVAPPVRAIDVIEDEFEDLTEEEQMRLAMELSMAPDPDADV
ncbi:uncharacterized protein PFL1_06652 [Pseudozyma flocculosa PF-1]|uniref:DNA excision repair protein ERCC-1 n=2 Tax=Pseudozyma flocculosa TaxID=84751 RepID=A0A5C3F9U6_9BASI|nr:uncharacterized protein PFL1_06652 [Pseudozyma flocculosa PF-1]EPQ25785.1 hypothetical protein PFL1_06652 [Pseudozyma flocculosa PF-1]SPO40517.1 related to dna excision repair protein ercc-1 [Pseudozyma flocculosa]